MNALHIYTQTDFTKDLKWDSSLRLVFLLKGDLSIHVGTVERHLLVHDFTFIRPFEIYGGCTASPDCRAYLIDIAPELWESICPDADKLHFSLSILKANDKHNAYQSVCRALAQIVNDSQNMTGSASARICRSVSDIIATLLDNFADEQHSIRPAEQTSVRVQSILRYISENYARRLSLEEIAGEIGFHPQYFSAYFKKQFGTNFTDYLNRYRINKSVNMLRDSQESILNIALSCGFNNHKTFSNAFEKVYGCSPREYRKLLLSDSGQDNGTFADEDFDYLRRFRAAREDNAASFDTARTKCSIYVNDDKSLFENTSHHMISIGRAISGLRSDLREQLRNARSDLNLEYVRIRDIFSDDLFVYYEDKNKVPVFSWRALDEILDYLVSIDVKPFIEIGYMPAQLASRKQLAGWQYHPNVSAPKSNRQWEQLVSAFISHVLARYGKEKVESWLFDFWTSPNLQIQHGYWNESMESFFAFYEITYHAVKRLDPALNMGSPNFSYPSGMDWYHQFFEFAAAKKLLPDFLSIHLYSCDDGQDTPGRTFMRYSTFDNNYSIPNIKPVRSSISEALSTLRGAADRGGLSELPIIIDDWNVTFFPTDYTRDTCFMGPYIAENYFNTCDKVYGMSFSSLSDIHEDFFNTDQLYNGGPGLLTYNGIPKASYHALGMALRFSRRILQKGEHYVVGKTDSGYEILLYNMDFYNDDYVGNDPSVISFTSRYNVFEETTDLDCHIELSVEEGTYSITRSLIGRQSGSSYDIWTRLGSPMDINPEITRYLRNISTPELKFQVQRTARSIILDEIVEPHSVLYIEISKI